MKQQDKPTQQNNTQVISQPNTTQGNNQQNIQQNNSQVISQPIATQGNDRQVGPQDTQQNAAQGIPQPITTQGYNQHNGTQVISQPNTTQGNDQQVGPHGTQQYETQGLSQQNDALGRDADTPAPDAPDTAVDETPVYQSPGLNTDIPPDEEIDFLSNPRQSFWPEPKFDW